MPKSDLNNNQYSPLVFSLQYLSRFSTDALARDIIMQTVHEEDTFENADAIFDFLSEIGVEDEEVARKAASSFFSHGYVRKAAIMGLQITDYDKVGMDPLSVIKLVHDRLQAEKNKSELKIGEDAKVILGASTFAKAKDVWSFPEEDVGKHASFKNCFEYIRRMETPDCYADLASAVKEDNFEQWKHKIVHFTKKSSSSSVSAHSTKTEGGTETKSIRNVASIFDHASISYSRAHQIGKAPECAYFYGHPAEGVVGVRFDEDDDQKELKQRLLVYGVEEVVTQDEKGDKKKEQAIQGLRDRKDENMLAVNSQHKKYFDNLTKGNVIILPICDRDFIQSWQQGKPYDLLVVGSNEATYTWMAVNAKTRGISKAVPQEIEMATSLAQDFTKGLLDLILNQETPEPPEEGLTDEQKKTVGQIKAKLGHMTSIRGHIKKKKQVTLPTARKSFEGDVLKVSLADWPSSEYADPFLVALRGAINLYWEGSGILRHRLFPACPDSFPDGDASSASQDSSGGSSGSWDIPLSLLPKDIFVGNIVRDDEDNFSDVSET